MMVDVTKPGAVLQQEAQEVILICASGLSKHCKSGPGWQWTQTELLWLPPDDGPGGWEQGTPELQPLTPVGGRG